MTRTADYSALILRTRASGESNRELWILTAEEGILRATMFGGPKSRLRSHAAPFHSGRVWLYHDPVRNTRKLNDFDVQSWRPGLRELYDRTMAADALAETILASHGGGGNWETALAIAEPILDSLADANEEMCVRLLVHFFWRWTGFLGIQPDIDTCSLCGAEIAAEEAVWYGSRVNACCCPACMRRGAYVERGGAANYILLNSGSRVWLQTTAPLPPEKLKPYALDTQSYKEVKLLTQTILGAALGKRPASWSW